MLNQKKVEIFLRKFRKSPAKQFLEIAKKNSHSKQVYVFCRGNFRYFVFCRDCLYSKTERSVCLQHVVGIYRHIVVWHKFHLSGKLFFQSLFVFGMMTHGSIYLLCRYFYHYIIFFRTNRYRV